MKSQMNQRGQNFYTGQESQVSKFVKKFQPEYKHMDPKYRSLCTDLQNALQIIFPGCKIHRFGSTVTGLYFTDSDVNIFVELGEKVLTGAHNLVIKSTTVLHKYRNIFKNVTAIPTERAPICKCVHIPTNIHCDFSFKSVIGVYNSSFVRYFLSLDQRLAHLMLIIKYWAKIHGLSGTAGFCNYSLVLLFIFYLQQVHSLPPVIELQRVNSVNVQENWNVGIDYSLSFISHSLNSIMAEDILFDFFDYYAYFNYDLDIICPYLGRPITKDEFIQFDSLESQFQFYKINTTVRKPLQLVAEMCLQDPFEHNNNVTSRVQRNCVKQFVALCKQACQIFERRPVSCRALEELFERTRPVNIPLRNQSRTNVDNNKIEQMFRPTDERTNRNTERRKRQHKHKKTSSKAQKI